MPPERAEGFTEYLNREAGEYLRGVVSYGDDYEVLFVRDDVRRANLKSQVDGMIEYLRRESRAREERVFPFERLNGTVRSFEEVVVMHFPLTQSRGIVVTLDSNAARQLNGFMAQCIERL